MTISGSEEMNKRQMINAGFRSVTGYIWNDHDCNVYNRLQNEINTWIEAGRSIPENLLNESFHVFCTLSMRD